MDDTPEPVLFILGDLHWTDPSTLEFIEWLIDQTPTVSICILLTCRFEYQPTWSHRSYLPEMTLNRLSRQQVEQVATRMGLTYIGLLGMLLEAKRKGVLPEVKPVLDDLVAEAGFGVSSELYTRVLQAAGE